MTQYDTTAPLILVNGDGASASSFTINDYAIISLLIISVLIAVFICLQTLLHYFRSWLRVE